MENDTNVLIIKYNILANLEVEIYIAYEFDDYSARIGETISHVNSNDEGRESDEGEDYEKEDEFHGSDYEFEEDDRILIAMLIMMLECIIRVIADHGVFLMTFWLKCRINKMMIIVLTLIN